MQLIHLAAQQARDTSASGKARLHNDKSFRSAGEPTSAEEPAAKKGNLRLPRAYGLVAAQHACSCCLSFVCASFNFKQSFNIGI